MDNKIRPGGIISEKQLFEIDRLPYTECIKKKLGLLRRMGKPPAEIAIIRRELLGTKIINAKKNELE